MAELRRAVIRVGTGKYPITTEEDPRYVETLGDEIDKQVTQLVNNRMSLTEALVLVSLNYLDLYKKSEESADHLRGQITEYLDEAREARSEADEAKRELAQLKSKGGGRA